MSARGLIIKSPLTKLRLCLQKWRTLVPSNDSKRLTDYKIGGVSSVQPPIRQHQSRFGKVVSVWGYICMYGSDENEILCLEKIYLLRRQHMYLRNTIYEATSSNNTQVFT